MQYKWNTSKTNYKPKEKGSKFIDRTGFKIGRLTLEYPVKLKKIIYWMCLCDCGNKTLVSVSSLNSGSTKSCGCLQKELIIVKNRKCWKGYGELSGNYFSQIRYNAKKRKIYFDITTEYLWHLFIKQEKKCILSGVTLTFGDKRKKQRDQTASLDRIDASKGYIEGNVQWVHKIINIMKGKQDSKEFIKLCIMIGKHNNGEQSE